MPLFRWLARYWPLVAVVSIVSSGVLYAALPPGVEHFEADYVAWRWLEGDVPYRDVIDMNWPGEAALHALGIQIFGHRMFAWRAVDFTILLVTLGFLADLLRRAFATPAYAWLLVIYPPLYVAAGDTRLPGQRDVLAAHVLFVALWFHWRAYRESKLVLQVGAGASVAVAMLLKPTVAPFAVALLAHGFLLASGRRLRSVAANGLVMGAAAAGVLLLAFGAVVVRGATLDDVWTTMFVYNARAQYLDSISNAELWSAFWHYQWSWWHFIGLFGLTTVVYLVASGVGAASVTFLPALWLTGFVSYFVQAKGNSYHLGICYACELALLAVGLGAAGAGLVRASQSLVRTGVAVSSAAVVLVGTARKVGGIYHPLALLGGAEASNRFADAPANDGMSMRQAVDLSRRVAQEVPPGGTIFLFGTANVINFLSARPQATRFFYGPTLRRLVATLPMAERWNALFRADLERNKPALCLVESDLMAEAQRDDIESVRYLTELLRTDYEESDRVGRLVIYRRLPRPAAP